jgi:hypothetical protein
MTLGALEKAKKVLVDRHEEVIMQAVLRKVRNEKNSAWCKESNGYAT